ncbi:hypothetical protein KY284_017829 [Solanum tuberosum]|nr:hypothetical protein KY284_017829 [Solanum tuberosum]
MTIASFPQSSPTERKGNGYTPLTTFTTGRQSRLKTLRKGEVTNESSDGWLGFPDLGVLTPSVARALTLGLSFTVDRHGSTGPHSGFLSSTSRFPEKKSIKSWSARKWEQRLKPLGVGAFQRWNLLSSPSSLKRIVPSPVKETNVKKGIPWISGKMLKKSFHFSLNSFA